MTTLLNAHRVITLPNGTKIEYKEGAKASDFSFDSENANFDFGFLIDPELTIDCLGLSVRVYSILMKYGISKVAFLQDITPEDLMSLRFFPEAGVEELNERVKEVLGFKLFES